MINCFVIYHFLLVHNFVNVVKCAKTCTAQKYSRKEHKGALELTLSKYQQLPVKFMGLTPQLSYFA